jgi:flagellar hook-associated protein 1 FlgK
MPQLNALLNIGGNALLLHQKAMTVTGNNIANVNTPGYTRQRLNITTRTPVQGSGGPMGYGAQAKGVERIQDKFVGVQLHNANAGLGRWEAQKSSLERAQFSFNETEGYGLNQALSEMWNAWRDLTLNPSGQTERVVLVTQAQFLADTVQTNYADLETVQDEIDTAIDTSVEEINRLTAEIADLNVRIIERETPGHEANEYRDRRDLAVKKLSNYLDISAFEDSEGRILVSTADGRVLVHAGSNFELSTQMNAQNHLDVYWNDSTGPTNISANIRDGKLRGWLDTRDTLIEGYKQDLDDLAQTLIAEVNGLHASGYGLDNSTGRDFFSGSGATDFEVHTDIVADETRVAASLTLGGVPGDNGNAIEIANLQHALTMSSNSATFDDFVNSLVSGIGHDVRRAGIYEEQQQATMEYVENYRESVSGVSLDEEMINLVKHQTAYDAAAKLVTTANEMLDTLLGLIR